MEPFTNKELDVKVQKYRNNGQAGFTLIESICAIAILTVGLIGTAVAISDAMKFSRIGRNVNDAKAIALAEIEQIHSLRDSRRLTFRQIANAGAVNNAGSDLIFAGFVTTFQQVADDPGLDGIFGTGDDLPSPPDKFGFTRRTLISFPTDPITMLPITDLKQIVVTVNYPGADGQTYTLSCTSYINNDLKQ
jgi:prepilin-type N-terminal cleavage/methylation domain-containing protein